MTNESREAAARLALHATELQHRRAARSRLINFATYTFPAYRPAPHLQLLAQHLEAVERGEISRLLVTMPPRHGKSELVSIRFPTWYLGRNPERRVVLTSYSGDLAHRFSRQARNLIESDTFRLLFPGLVLAQDSSRMDAFDFAERRGGLRAVGVGGALTGHGAHLLLIDDPCKNRVEADSDTMRLAAWDWYVSTAYSRLEECAAIVLTSTRWHDDDIAGRLLAAQSLDPRADQWTVLHLPAISDGGEPLWPEKYPLEDLLRIQANIGPRDWEALYQGQPRPVRGAIFQADWFRILDRPPEDLDWVRYWDLATSTKTSADFTASARCALGEDGTLYISDIIRGRWEWPDARRLICRTAQLEHGVAVGVEKTGFQLAAVQDLRREPAFVSVELRGVPVDRDKHSRALPWAARAEAGKVTLIAGPWVKGFLSECVAFPHGRHDDLVDAVSGSLQMLGEETRVGIRAWLV